MLKAEYQSRYLTWERQVSAGKAADLNTKSPVFAICRDNPSLFVLHKIYSLWIFVSHHPGNYYGTPKPPAEPSPVQPDLVDQVLFDEEFDTEVQRKRTTSVSKMDRKDSAAPDEEEEEEKPPMVNGLAGERQGCNYHTGFPDLVFCLLNLFFILFRGSLLNTKQQGPHFHSNDSVPTTNIPRISISSREVSIKSQMQS